MAPTSCRWNPKAVDGTRKLSMAPTSCKWHPQAVEGTYKLNGTQNQFVVLATSCNFLIAFANVQWHLQLSIVSTNFQGHPQAINSTHKLSVLFRWINHIGEVTLLTNRIREHQMLLRIVVLSNTLTQTTSTYLKKNIMNCITASAIICCSYNSYL